MARSFLKEMRLPLTLWGEAVTHTIYVLHRLPTRALTGKTPREAWTGAKPDVSYIRVFGSVAHMKVQSGHTTKLEDRSKMVIYLGREPGTKASRLYDPISGKILVSRDVVGYRRIDEGSNFSGNGRVGNGASISSNETEGNGESGATMSNSPSSISLLSSNTDEISTSSGDSNQPNKFHLLDEIYNETQEIELEDDLLLLGIEEPTDYKQAAKDKEWELEMKLETVRLLLALASKNGWVVDHLDVKSAFLNGELEETVYVTQAEGFIKEGK
ncbi:uncharacterized protein LOC141701990 [Apium graveolens]|uniref:uncharacterized protein LOC141701990 n=1 Tax=Apium graveolens TaxID=4045 RepID=UPI003D7A4399